MKKGNLLIVTGLLLIAAALLLTGYNLWDNYRAGQAANEALAQLVPLMSTPVSKPVQTAEPLKQEEKQETQDAPLEEAQEAPVIEVVEPDYVSNPEKEMPVQNVYGADYIGILSIPALKRELPVFSEWNYVNLKKAPCRYTGTVYLDNMVICAHNYDIHFGSLKNLKYGDAVDFTDMDGNVFHYQVVEIETLQPTAIEEMTIGDWDLTLFTCTVGGAARVAARCEKIEN